jgi:hypothetical protein
MKKPASGGPEAGYEKQLLLESSNLYSPIIIEQLS